MKKYILILAVTLLLLGVSYIIIKELTYSPLKEKDFKNLFPDYDGNAKKKCHADFIGLSLQGELFDIFIYKLNEITIDFQYPNFKNGWANITMPNGEFVFSKWKKCPVDSLTFFRYKDMLTIKDFSEKKCTYFFNSDLANSMNYYSYLYINELEHYFCLYCPDKNYLYYVRKKGW
jgi:hypothetical protein